MPPFAFDRAKAERSMTDPDGALWPVNVYSDADELNGLVQAAIESEAITRPNRRAHLYIYPLSLSEPDPVLVYDPGHGRAFLGFSLKLREREGESPVEFTLRLLDDVTAEANELAADSPRPSSCEATGDLNLRCPDCCSEGASAVDHGVRLECDNCGASFSREQALVAIGEVGDASPHAESSESRSVTVSSQHADARSSWSAEVRADRPEQLDELVRLAADAEIGLTVYEEAPCTCSPSRGCPQCFSRADATVGKTVRDGDGHEWKVTDVDEKDGFPTVCDDDRWAYLADVEVVE